MGRNARYKGGDLETPGFRNSIFRGLTFEGAPATLGLTGCQLVGFSGGQGSQNHEPREAAAAGMGWHSTGVRILLLRGGKSTPAYVMYTGLPSEQLCSRKSIKPRRRSGDGTNQKGGKKGVVRVNCQVCVPGQFGSSDPIRRCGFSCSAAVWG